jgi:3-phosphoshikimate 1-carboxyvinyltransferase
MRCIKFSGSKSILQRLLAIQAICRQTVQYQNYSSCADVLEMQTALLQTGFSSRVGDGVVLYPDADVPADNHYYFHESATALRLWIAVCAVREGQSSVIRSSDQLIRRPIEPLLKALRELGADITGEGGTLYINGKRLTGGTVSLPADISSQFYSSLILIAPTMQQPLHLKIPADLVSRAYLDLTMDLVLACGIRYTADSGSVSIDGNQQYQLDSPMFIEADWSSAAFFICLGTLLEDGLSCELNYSYSRQPDAAIVDILLSLGAKIDIHADHLEVHQSTLQGGMIDCGNNPDLVPILACLALFGSAPLCLNRISHLKYKESDRITGITAILDAIKADYTLAADALTVYPMHHIPPAAVLETQNDHRLMMAGALLCRFYPVLRLSETASVTKSFLEFWDILHAIDK